MSFVFIDGIDNKEINEATDNLKFTVCIQDVRVA